MSLKLYLVSQSICTGYDTWDSMVVTAENEEDARHTHPSSGWGINEGVSPTDPAHWKDSWGGWAGRPKDVQVTFLGIAAKELDKAGVVCASFNAG